MIALDGATVHPVLESYVTEARRDPATIGVLLHGSRASGRHRDDSDYDLIRIVAQEAYDLRRDAEQLHERIRLEGGLVGDVLFRTPSRIEAGVYNPGWFTATYCVRSPWRRTSSNAAPMRTAAWLAKETGPWRPTRCAGWAFGIIERGPAVLVGEWVRTEDEAIHK